MKIKFICNRKYNHYSSPDPTDSLWLQIAMDYPIAVNILDGLEHPPGQITRMFFGVNRAFAQPVKNVSTARQFQDEVEGLRLLEEVN